MPERAVAKDTPPQRSVPESVHDLWSSDPILRKRSKHTYYGRIFVEVRDNDIQLVTDNDALVAKARAALKSQFKSVHPETALAPEPATGEGSNLLGRVIIEFWDDQPIVAVLGADPRVLKRAKKMLQDDER